MYETSNRKQTHVHTIISSKTKTTTILSLQFYTINKILGKFRVIIQFVI